MHKLVKMTAAAAVFASLGACTNHEVAAAPVVVQQPIPVENPQEAFDRRVAEDLANLPKGTRYYRRTETIQ